MQVKPSIISYIIQVINTHRNQQNDEIKLVSLGRMNFFLKLGELINDASDDGTVRGDYIRSFVDGE